MTPEEYAELHPQSKEYVCTEHGTPKARTGFGTFVCMFCEREEWEATTTTQSELED